MRSLTELLQAGYHGNLTTPRDLQRLARLSTAEAAALCFVSKQTYRRWDAIVPPIQPRFGCWQFMPGICPGRAGEVGRCIRGIYSRPASTKGGLGRATSWSSRFCTSSSTSTAGSSARAKRTRGSRRRGPEFGPPSVGVCCNTPTLYHGWYSGEGSRMNDHFTSGVFAAGLIQACQAAVFAPSVAAYLSHDPAELAGGAYGTGCLANALGWQEARKRVSPALWPLHLLVLKEAGAAVPVQGPVPTRSRGWFGTSSYSELADLLAKEPSHIMRLLHAEFRIASSWDPKLWPVGDVL